MVPKSTSFRLAEATRQRLSRRGEREGFSATAMPERLIHFGVPAARWWDDIGFN